MDNGAKDTDRACHFHTWRANDDQRGDRTSPAENDECPHLFDAGIRSVLLDIHVATGAT